LGEKSKNIAAVARKKRGRGGVTVELSRSAGAGFMGGRGGGSQNRNFAGGKGFEGGGWITGLKTLVLRGARRNVYRGLTTPRPKGNARGERSPRSLSRGKPKMCKRARIPAK